MSTIDKALYHPNLDMRANLYEIDGLNLEIELTNALKQQARSIACMVQEKSLIRTERGYKLDPQTPTLKRGNMKASEAFTDEKTPGFGTAFLVGKRIALTAAHCVCHDNSNALDQPGIQSTYLVLDFHIAQKGQCRETFERDDVYRIKKVIAHRFSRHGQWADWALIKLDREAVNVAPLPLNFDEQIANQIDLYMLGHPSGLPLKFARNAEIKQSDHPGYFEANLDAFAGNSGSPVFHRIKREVIGMLVGGNKDYDDQNPQHIEAHHVTAHEIALLGYEKCHRIHTLDFVKQYIQSSEMGDVSAQYSLGLHYLHANVKKATAWLQKAADQGHVLAQQKFNEISEDKLINRDDASPYKQPTRGMNFEISCQTRHCNSHGQEIYTPIGLGEYNVAQQIARLHCNGCAQPPTIHRLIFWNCQYHLEGLQTYPQQQSISKTAKIGDKKLKTYELENKRFTYLEVKTQ